MFHILIIELTNLYSKIRINNSLFLCPIKNLVKSVKVCYYSNITHKKLTIKFIRVLRIQSCWKIKCFIE